MPDFRYSLRALLIGMILACLTLGTMRALASWKSPFWSSDPLTRYPTEIRRQICRELDACNNDKDPKDCRAVVASRYGFSAEAAEAILQEGIRQVWIDSPRRPRR